MKLSKKNKKIIKINGLETKKKIHIQIIDHLNSRSLYKKKTSLYNLVMIQQNKIIGHSDQINILKSNYNKNFPHAWIFNGIKGIGKYSTAINFIKSVNNKNSTMNSICLKSIWTTI